MWFVTLAFLIRFSFLPVQAAEDRALELMGVAQDAMTKAAEHQAKAEAFYEKAADYERRANEKALAASQEKDAAKAGKLRAEAAELIKKRDAETEKGKQQEAQAAALRANAKTNLASAQTLQDFDKNGELKIDQWETKDQNGNAQDTTLKIQDPKGYREAEAAGGVTSENLKGSTVTGVNGEKYEYAGVNEGQHTWKGVGEAAGKEMRYYSEGGSDGNGSMVEFDPKSSFYSGLDKGSYSAQMEAFKSSNNKFGKLQSLQGTQASYNGQSYKYSHSQIDANGSPTHFYQNSQGNYVGMNSGRSAHWNGSSAWGYTYNSRTGRYDIDTGITGVSYGSQILSPAQLRQALPNASRTPRFRLRR